MPLLLPFYVRARLPVPPLTPVFQNPNLEVLKPHLEVSENLEVLDCPDHGLSRSEFILDWVDAHSVFIRAARLSRGGHLGPSPSFSGSAAVAAGLSNPPTPKAVSARW